MAIRARDAFAQTFEQLRYEPTEKRIRGTLGGETVVDTTRALLLWEPRRISPMYAVPRADLKAGLKPEGPVEPGGPAFLHPGIPFAVHSTDGESLSVTAGGETREGAAFAVADPDLAAYVVLDFAAMDWREEDEPMRGHPRDPYHRVDVRASSRHLRIEHDGRLLADTRRPTLLFETNLPTRFYVPREDVVADLRPGDMTSHCPYKGDARYWSTAEYPNVAWEYPEPYHDVAPIAGLVAFWDDRLELTLDGRRRERAHTLASDALLKEFDV
jgi:uncharacterized protein (DUF427 family)